MTIYPTPGNPNVNATASDQWLIGDPGYNYIGYSGATDNTVSYQLASGPVTASLLNPSINTAAAAGDTYSDIQFLTGSPYGGSLYGLDNGLADQLWALGGATTLYGGSGYTTFIAGSGPTYMLGQTSGGDNLADYETAPTGLTVDLANPSLNTGYAAGDVYSNVSDIAGSAYDDLIIANNDVHANLLGNGGDNILIAGTGDDTLNGGPGANVLVGGAGNDIFVFGGTAQGPGDVAMDPLSLIYGAEAGLYSRITNFDQGSGSYNTNQEGMIDLAPLVSSLNDGSDSVNSLVKVVEDTSGSFAWLEFDGPNGWLTLARMDGVVAGDNVGVIINSGSTTLVNVQATAPTNETNTDEWLLASGQWSASVSPGSYPGPDEKVVAIGDFTGNGIDDVLWYNVNTGDVSSWELQNGQWSQSVDFGTHPGPAGGSYPGTGWQVEAVGNFTGNGIDDIFFYNAGDDQTDLWELGSNGQWAASVTPGAQTGVGWQVVGTGNFFGNSTSDLLWENTQTGDVQDWQMSNGLEVSSVDLGAHPGSGWQIVGVGNFFGGSADNDVLWYNANTGQTDGWELANGEWAGSFSLGTHPTGSEVAAVGNFAGNNTSDVLFYNPTNGNVDEWDIQNGQWAGSIALGAHPGSNWQIAGVGQFTSSGTTDVLFTQTATK